MGVVLILTRGKLLGEILDGLGQLSFVIETRGKLGLFDLNRYCEDFTKELLNLIYDYKLKNLNENRSNEPGLDLGDSEKKVAVQVTSNKRTDKINTTLEKITTEQKETYDKVIILILGTKQKTYDRVDPNLVLPMNFKVKENILDFQDIERDIVTLTTERIKEVYDFLSNNLIRIYGDLDVAETPTGEATTLLEKLEERPKFTYRNCMAIIKYQEEEHNISIDEKVVKQMEEDFSNFFSELIKLPRITREFFYALVSRSEYDDGYDKLVVDDEKMRRFLPISTLRYNEELRLLEKSKLLEYVQEGDFYNLIRFNGYSSTSHTLYNIVEFAGKKNHDLKTILMDLDFSCIAT